MNEWMNEWTESWGQTALVTVSSFDNYTRVLTLVDHGGSGITSFAWCDDGPVLQTIKPYIMYIYNAVF